MTTIGVVAFFLLARRSVSLEEESGFLTIWLAAARLPGLHSESATFMTNEPTCTLMMLGLLFRT